MLGIAIRFGDRQIFWGAWVIDSTSIAGSNSHRRQAAMVQVIYNRLKALPPSITLALVNRARPTSRLPLPSRNCSDSCGNAVIECLRSKGFDRHPRARPDSRAFPDEAR